MHAIVADVARAREAEGLPLRSDLAAEGGRRRVDRVSRSEAGAAEVSPGGLRLVPLNDELWNTTRRNITSAKPRGEWADAGWAGGKGTIVFRRWVRFFREVLGRNLRACLPS